MSDYVSREEAEKRLLQRAEIANSAYIDQTPYQNVVHLIPDADVRPPWISVKERLPEPWWPVLGLIRFHDREEPPSQQVLWHLGYGNWRSTWNADRIEGDVTHWMPLFAPPPEEE